MNPLAVRNILYDKIQIKRIFDQTKLAKKFELLA